MPDFSQRLSVWTAQMAELGEKWPGRRFESVTGINRGWWEQWLHAHDKEIRGEHVRPSCREPNVKQWALIFAAMPLDFVVSFDDYRPGLAEVANANRVCAWCGRGFRSRYPARYCSDRHWGEMQMWRRAQRRIERRVSA